MRRKAIFPIEEIETLQTQLLAWASAFSVAAYLDSNGHRNAYSSWDCLVAVGAADAVLPADSQAFPALHAFLEKKRDWCFGFFGYDLKNEVEKLSSAHSDRLGFPDLYFFQPEIVAGIRNGQLEIFSLEKAPETIRTDIQAAAFQKGKTADAAPVLQPRFRKSEYLRTVESIRQHIVEGDLYEMNLCQEFYAESAEINPLTVFSRLNALANAPFSAFFRLNDRYLLCASPERFLKKTGDLLVSQPIKGTRRRGQNPEEDDRIRAELSTSEKDRAENVMIVDLVRNDLARHCLPGTVAVDELFGIHSFTTVHQMISTVTGRLRPGANALDALRDAFPMGSMTGAPKVMAMELIERYERSRRGLYSGAVGYFSPEGDFDFNVVIRSILYDALSGYLSVQVGGAIVYDSIPEEEYAECLVKAEVMLRALD